MNGVDAADAATAELVLEGLQDDELVKNLVGRFQWASLGTIMFETLTRGKFLGLLSAATNTSLSTVSTISGIAQNPQRNRRLLWSQS